MSALPEYLINLQEHLSQKQTKAAAWAIIDEYISFFGKEGINNDLWKLLVGALGSDELEGMEKARERYNLIFFFEYTQLFVVAVHLLYEKRTRKKRRPANVRHQPIPSTQNK